MRSALVSLVMATVLIAAIEVGGCKPTHIRNEKKEYHNHTHHHDHRHEHIHKYYFNDNGELIGSSSSSGTTVDRPDFLSSDFVDRLEKNADAMTTKQSEEAVRDYSEKSAEEVTK